MRRKEPVRVAVIFEPGKRMHVVWFEHNHRRHKVMQTTYHWNDRVGETPLQHFTVTDGEALYELIYSPLDGNWTLVDQQAVA